MQIVKFEPVHEETVTSSYPTTEDSDQYGNKTGRVEFFTWLSHAFAGRTDTSIDYVYVLIIRPDTYEKLFGRKIVIFFLPINLNMCFGSSKEPSAYVLVEK